MGVTVGIVALAMFLSKNKEKLIKTLNILAIISILMRIATVGIKLYMDSQYNEKTFGQFYDQYESVKGNYTGTAKVILGKSWTFEIIDSKEAYIRNSKTAYMQFTIKQILYVIINVLISIEILYLADRISKINPKSNELYINMPIR